MSKQRKKLITKIITGVITAGIISSNIRITSYADEIKNELTTDEIMAIPGLVYIVTDFGTDIEPSIITEGYFGSDYYGYALFNRDDVLKFIKWIVEEDSKYAKVFNIEHIEDIIGTEEFNELWRKASELDKYDFTLKQQTYKLETIVKSIIDDLELEIGMNISGHKGIEELIYSKSMTYGNAECVKFMREALSGYSDIKDINFDDVVDKVTKSEIEYIEGKTSISEKVREAMINGVNKESQYLKEIHSYSIKYNAEQEKEDTNTNTNTDSNTDTDTNTELEAVKTSINENNINKFKNYLLDLISKIFKF